MRPLLIAAAAAAALLAVLSAPLRAAETTTFTLDNGMEVVVLEDHRAPVVVHMVWYRAGSADEPPGKSGIAHFLEHLLFKGTDDMAPGEFSNTVARNGGSDNAFTSYDTTAYFQRVAADRLELMMRMEADRMRDLVLTQADILTERDVIIEERNQRTDSNPNAMFGEQRMAAQYLNHPYGVPIIGWRHEVDNLGLCSGGADCCNRQGTAVFVYCCIAAALEHYQAASHRAAPATRGAATRACAAPCP